MKKPTLLEQHLGYWLRFVSNHVSSSFAKKLEAYDLSVADWVVLNLLNEQSQLSSSEIAKTLGLTRGAVSKLLDRLCFKEFIVRKESKKDRRYQEIGLSDAGKTLLPRLIEIADQNDQEFFGHLTQEDQQSLIATLKEIVFLQKIPHQPIQ